MKHIENHKKNVSLQRYMKYKKIQNNLKIKAMDRKKKDNEIILPKRDLN